MNKQTLCLVGGAVGSYLAIKHYGTPQQRPVQPHLTAEHLNQQLFLLPQKFKFTTTLAFCDAVTNSESGADILSSTDAEVPSVLEENDQQPSKKRVGFKERRFIEYENRIRAYSTPDKIFRYFATYKIIYENGQSDIYMTPEDFLRSITPGEVQPENLGLDKYKVKKVTDNIKMTLPAKELSAHNNVFHALGECGFISFSDYLFLLTVLSTPARNFEIAFQMFDLNGDGDVDVEEFQQVTNTARSQTSIGMRHRDHKNTGNVVRPFSESNSAIITYFFGPPEDRKKLTVKRFIEFQKNLQEDILYLEFAKHADEDGILPEVKFIRMLLAYSGLSDKKQKAILKRVRKEYKKKKPAEEDEGSAEKGEEAEEEEQGPLGLTFEECRSFFEFLKHINDIDLAFDFYNYAGTDIDKETLKQVAKTVASEDISDHIIDVVFTAFDEDGNGTLSNKEFVAVMKRRLMRGLEKPKDTGLFRLLEAAWQCALKTTLDSEVFSKKA